MLVSIGINYVFARAVDAWRGQPRARWILAGAVVVNIGLLGVFKYANFAVDNLNALLAGSGVPPLHLPPIALPIGISFFTFHALSYVIDVHRRDAPVQPSVTTMGLYIALFPQLVAGPIIRYRDVARQLTERVVTRAGFASGVERFVIGLGKKVLIANTLAGAADVSSRSAGSELTSGHGLARRALLRVPDLLRLLGLLRHGHRARPDVRVQLPRELRPPLLARSLTEFWRRWHISLSTWFRDYLYIPLGGNRVAPGGLRETWSSSSSSAGCGTARAGTSWSGAWSTAPSWCSSAWASVDGSRSGPGRFATATPCWSCCSAGSSSAPRPSPRRWAFCRRWRAVGPAPGASTPSPRTWTPEVRLALAAGVRRTTPVLAGDRRLARAGGARGAALEAPVSSPGVCAAWPPCSSPSAPPLAAGTHNPFIYFRF